MNRVSAFSRFSAGATVAAAILLFAAATPAFAQSTAGTSIQTGELLPPGQNTCQMVSVTDIQPHVYGGVLESFDVTISDTSNSYVGILAQVGNMPIPLDYITRWAGMPGLRIHVDTPNITVGNGQPVDLTLLSSPPGAPTCITTVSFDVTGYGIAPNTTPVQPTTPSSQYPSQGTTPSTPASNPPTGETSSGTTHTHPSTVMQGSSSTSTLLGGTVTSASNMKFFNEICAGSNAYRLWFILLVIYIIIVAVVVFAEPWFLADSVLGSTAAILVPLILLLAFWYFSSSCRAASWIPVVACVIAIVGLFLAFREYELPPLLPAPSEQ